MTFPSKVNLYEVGPRDGLQNEKEIIPTDVKVNLINKLINCNFKEIEIGSFVSPKWVPQMADSEIIIDKIKKYGRFIISWSRISNCRYGV